VKRIAMWLAVFGVSLPALPALHAADPIVPVVELRVKAINDLLGYAGYVGGMVGQEEQLEAAANLAKAFTNKKGLEGFDTKRPIGLYAGVTKDVSDSPVIALVPVVDEATVLAFLKDKANLNWKKDGEVYEVAVPKMPQPVYFKFADGYLHATIGNKANLDRALAPKTVFGKESDAVLSLAVHIDRIPADVKKVLLGQVEFQLQKHKDEMKDHEPSPAKRRMAAFALDGMAAMLKSILDDGKTIGLTFAVKPDADELTVDVALTPKSGTPLAAAMAGAGKKTSATAGRVTSKNPALSTSINLALPDKWKEKFVPVVDDFLNEVEASIDPAFADYLKKILASFEPTMKAGELDFAITLNGPNDDGKHELQTFLKMKKGLDLIDALKEFAKIFPASHIEPKFDTATINKVGVHSMTLHENPDDLVRMFGSNKVWMGNGEEMLAFSFEPDAKSLKKALAEPTKSDAIVSAELAIARLAVMTAEGDHKPKMQKMVKEIFGSTPTAGNDTVKLKVTGGDALTIRLTAKGKGLQTLAAIDKAKKD
jgi:hypothetical protein